ncbi:hypothetical protein [Microcoleus sp. FACHB-68]|uniref:hypothetical protein n=1 Tax=Microcoleus sp. FACHB-68 TaxID=2692826 RepID=UPI001683E267|nr:hypothetical protein [Microcoleus sp. FACHB-68]MBD1935846.1 hypothetical protein [Microcoleus sp. FACHB-68]
MPDLIPEQQSQLNGHYPQAASSDPQRTQVPTPDENPVIEHTDTNPDYLEPHGMNGLEKFVLVIAVILLFLATVNAGIAIYRIEHQNQQELQQ